ncbi:hypothetical protein T06_2111 [Trichinella sp. T6]|nr:hypothetical protein T06_2111 [Trichinella sp. T6]
MSSHEARTDANQATTRSNVHHAFQWRFLDVPVCLITNSRCTSQHFLLDSNGLRHQKILVADGTQIAFPTVLFFLVTQGSWHVYHGYQLSAEESVKYVASSAGKCIKNDIVEVECGGKGKYEAQLYAVESILRSGEPGADLRPEGMPWA